MMVVKSIDKNKTNLVKKSDILYSAGPAKRVVVKDGKIIKVEREKQNG